LVTGGINIYNSRRLSDGLAYWYNKKTVDLQNLIIPPAPNGLFEYTIISNLNYGSNDLGGVLRTSVRELTIKTTDDINGISEGSFVYLVDRDEWYTISSIQKVLKTKSKLVSNDPDCSYTISLRR